MLEDKNNEEANILNTRSEDQKVINNIIDNDINNPVITEEPSTDLAVEYSPKKNNKLVLKITLLVILLILSAWLIAFFFQGDDSDDILSNLNINGPSDNIVNNTEEQDNNTEEENNAEETTLDDGGITAMNSDSKPITVVNDDYRLSLEVPEQSVVISKEDIPAGSVTIIGNDDGFSPNIFYAQPGQEITLTLTADSASPVVLTFYDERMAAVAIGCSPGTTRLVTFTAPTEAGEYLFLNDVFGKREQQGKMIVR